MTTETDQGTDMTGYRERLDPDRRALLDDLLHDIEAAQGLDPEGDPMMAAVVELKRELEDIRHQLELDRIRAERGHQLRLTEAMH